MIIPRIVIAGTHSGCGKTTIAAGLMGALAARGYIVQPFKVGPDFIDPTHHTAICGRHSRNLDPFMMGEEGVLNTFKKACVGADIAVVEGVMGMYDGLEGADTCSTAHVARILSAPVLLVVDVKGMSRSANAMLKGYASFDPSIRIEGAIFNRLGSQNHKKMIEASLSVRALGWIPKRDDLEVKSRHLGLRMAGELKDRVRFGDVIGKYVDIDAVMDVAKAAGPLPGLARDATPSNSVHKVTIGVARDAAFCFYYQDNLDLLSSGARIVYFSPMDDKLPDVDALYFGGGYPELYAKELEASRCREKLKKAIDDGMPVYAECGGLMYLCQSLTYDKDYRMAGVLPARAEMTGRIQALGYVKAESMNGSIFPEGMAMDGHEFHYSRVACGHDVRFAFRLLRGKGIKCGRDGLFEHNAIGTYTHAYFTREFVDSLISAAELYNKS
ncbi:cobyrinate a,c-diamide synthase [Methanocella conradii]|uniref:cobyrinate a,c-diamide synthase n=1 Tax=Methanocella conradii TaxID=1175444 RepID=UPI00157DC64A|nr:cobyrinate a,c-diamide synthase [Methanocella conradii]